MVDKMLNEADRARAIVQQVDLVCDFSTGITTMIKNLAIGESTDDVEKVHDMIYHEPQDFILTLLDQNREIILNAKLREQL